MNTNQRLDHLCSRISAPSEEIQKEAEKRLLCLTKPPGSLGEVEKIAVRLAGIYGEVQPKIKRKNIVVMCGDHGVVEEGVSAFPSEITALMIENFASGKAAINVFARQVGAEVTVVDIGSKAVQLPSMVLCRKVKSGTNNMTKEPAMTNEEAIQAILIGADIAAQLIAKGSDLLVLGEMGIGNTTPSSAIAAVLLGRENLNGLVGRGTGIEESVLSHKEQVIQKAINLHRPDPKNPLDTLAKVGGLEIAGLVGVILGAAVHRRAVLVDGVIAGAAALVASRLHESVKSYLFASHLSSEPAHQAMLEDLGLTPLLHLQFRLGEGTGAALAVPIMEAACGIMSEMATFADLGLPNPV